MSASRPDPQIQNIDQETLLLALKAERRRAYIKLKGGVPVATAGLLYWLALGVWGYSASLYEWAMAAYMGSALIFPVAVGLSYLFGAPFLTERQTVGFVSIAAIIGMLLFWPIVVAAGQMQYYELIPFILAIGLSAHWPVIGWSYGRTALYSLHAIVRAGTVLAVWITYPDERLTWMPLSVAAVYALTIVLILIDVSILSRQRR